MRFDPTYLDLGEPLDASDNPRLKAQVLREHYPDAEEAIPTNVPTPRGKPVQINCFVDADHAGNLVTRRSQTGILIYLNMAPIFGTLKSRTPLKLVPFRASL